MFEPECYADAYEEEVETWQALAREHVVDLDSYRQARPKGPVTWRKRPAAQYQPAMPDEWPF